MHRPGHIPRRGAIESEIVIEAAAPGRATTSAVVHIQETVVLMTIGVARVEPALRDALAPVKDGNNPSHMRQQPMHLTPDKARKQPSQCVSMALFAVAYAGTRAFFSTPAVFLSFFLQAAGETDSSRNTGINVPRSRSATHTRYRRRAPSATFSRTASPPCAIWPSGPSGRGVRPRSA